MFAIFTDWPQNAKKLTLTTRVNSRDTRQLLKSTIDLETLNMPWLVLTHALI